MNSSNQKIKSILIDNESSSLESLSVQLKKIPFLDLSSSFTNPVAAINFIKRNKVDLIISEIEMNGLNGIQLINSLKIKPLVILVSSEPKYAIDGYEIDAIDFLLKPVNFDRLLRAANKAYDQFFGTKEKELSGNIVAQSFNQDIIFVKSNYRILKINLADILFIEGFNDYVKIHLINSNPVLTLLSLRNLEEKLPNMEFARVHRSYIVSLRKIDNIEKKRIKIGKYTIPISQSYFESFFNSMDKKNFYIY
jgi:two-component system, LytTR family, response regulator